MSYRDQSKYFECLKRFERKFDWRELEDYKILLERHKDEEDFDKESLEWLKELYVKYFVNREKKNFDDIFKKPTKDGK
ncbi:MAG: hypothetical protein NTX22_16860 [Ignavibacteriales bacterium]|nr:hypothetical protein [Ignavibacteriales bacterium]